MFNGKGMWFRGNAGVKSSLALAEALQIIHAAHIIVPSDLNVFVYFYQNNQHCVFDRGNLSNIS